MKVNRGRANHSVRVVPPPPPALWTFVFVAEAHS